MGTPEDIVDLESDSEYDSLPWGRFQRNQWYGGSLGQ